VVLTVISAGSVYLVNKARDDARWVCTPLKPKIRYPSRNAIAPAESAQRGFLLTCSPISDRFRGSCNPPGAALTRLGQLISDNPVERQLLDQMVALSNQRIEEFRQTIELARPALE